MDKATAERARSKRAALKEKLEASAPKPKVTSLADMYAQFRDENLERIQSSLKGYFGDNYELATIGNKNYSSLKSLLSSADSTSVTGNNKVLDQIVKGNYAPAADVRRYAMYQITIHFPELEVRNSSGGRHKITDMYIRLILSPFFNGAWDTGDYFRGLRMSFKYAEICSDYSFSHLHGGWRPRFSHFCLGSTDFAGLCADIRHSFNPDYFDLFCQQLPDYLSWESLEGGPYRRFTGIGERSSTGTYVSINITQMQAYYRKWLEKGTKFNAELISNPYYYGFSVIMDEQLKKDITAIVDNPAHLQLYDPATKQAFNEVNTGREGSISDIIRQSTSASFNFKGNLVTLQVTDAKDASKKKNEIRIAHQSILNYFTTIIDSEINKRVTDEFSRQ